MNLLKKAIAAICATAMLATFAVVPVMADGATKLYPETGAWFRFNGEGTGWNSGAILTGLSKETSNGSKEIQRNARFGAVYEFDLDEDVALNNIDTIKLTANVTVNADSNNQTLGAYIWDYDMPDTAFNSSTAGSDIYSNSATNTPTPIASVSAPANSFATITIKDSALTTLKSNADENGKVKILLTTNPFKTSTNKQLQINIDGANMPYMVINPEVAQIGGTTYESLEDAITAASAGDTITLLRDTTISNFTILSKALTFTGTGTTKPVISGQTLELAAALTASNVEFANTIDAKAQQLTLTDCDISGVLKVGGSYGNTNVALTNTTVSDVETYGRISLNGTSSITNSIAVKGIGNANSPRFIMNDTASVPGTATLSFDGSIDLATQTTNNYDLVDGTVANFTPTWSNSTYTVSSAGYIANTVAMIGNVGYADFKEAVAAAIPNDSTIDLVSDVDLGSSLYVIDYKVNNNKTAFTVAINGNNKSITGNIELANFGSYRLNANNVTFNGKFDVKNNGINFTGCTVNTLNVGGTGDDTRVILTNTGVTDLATYGHVRVVGTSTVSGTTTINGINSGSDKPQIIVGENASVTGTLALSDEIAAAHIGYSLVSGTLANFGATWSSENYGLVNGVIAEKSAPAPIYTDGVVYTPTATTSDDEKGFTASYSTEETSGTVDIEWKIIDLNGLANGQTFKTVTQQVDLTKAEQGAVKFGIVLTNMIAGHDYNAMWFAK